MLQKNKGIDIIVEIGGLKEYQAAAEYLESVLTAEHIARIQKIKNTEVIIKIANAISMCEPDDIFVNTGSEEDRRFIRELALEKGEEAPLAMSRHTIHFDLPEEQGRIIDRTYYIANEDEKISSLANRMDRMDAIAEVRDKMVRIMKIGRAHV